MTDRGSRLADPYTDFGRWVRLTRLQRGMSRRELAERAGISVPYVTKIENGDRRPQARVVRGLADALGVTPADLLHVPEAEDARVWRRDSARAPEVSEPSPAPAGALLGGWRPTASVAEPTQLESAQRATLMTRAMRLIADADLETLRAVVDLLDAHSGDRAARQAPDRP